MSLQLNLFAVVLRVRRFFGFWLLDMYHYHPAQSYITMIFVQMTLLRRASPTVHPPYLLQLELPISSSYLDTSQFIAMLMGVVFYPPVIYSFPSPRLVAGE